MALLPKFLVSGTMFHHIESFSVKINTLLTILINVLFILKDLKKEWKGEDFLQNRPKHLISVAPCFCKERWTSASSRIMPVKYIENFNE